MRKGIGGGDPKRDYGKLREKFVAMLQEGIDSKWPEHRGVTLQHFGEMQELAQSGDWSNIETIKELYRAEHRIRGEVFEEERLFGKGQ